MKGGPELPYKMAVDNASKRAKQELGTLIVYCRGTLSQSQLAKRVGLSRSNMKYIEDGVNAPTAEVYDKLIQELKPALQMRDILLKNEHLRDSARHNSLKDFRFAYFDAVQDALIAGYEQNQDFFALLLDNDEKKRELMQVFLDDIYKKLREASYSQI